MVTFGHNVLSLDSIKTSTGPIRLWDCHVEWSHLEPKNNHFEWSRLDELVAAAAGREIVLVLGHPPEWAAAPGGVEPLQAAWMLPRSNRPPRNQADWTNYVKAVAKRYRGKIKYYQIWNEPADKRFYYGSWTKLSWLCVTATAAIKSVDPSARVVSPPLQPRRQAGWNGRGQEILAAFRADKWPFDIVSAHIYPQIGEGPSAWKADLLKVRKATAIAYRPLWVTETNFNLVGPGNPLELGVQEAYKQAVRRICERENVRRVFWYGYGHSQPELFGVMSL